MPNSNPLKRQIGLFSAVAIVVANMVGTGIFTTSGFILQQVHHPMALLLCWAAGGLFALCGALCYGELGSRYPHAGGEYVYLNRSFGRTVAFLSGWISLIVGFSAPIAAAAYAFAVYLFRALGIGADSVIPLGTGALKLFSIPLPIIPAIAVVLIFSLLHSTSLILGSRVQNVLTGFKVVLLALFIIAGLWVTKGAINLPTRPLAMENLLNGKFAVALIFVSFAYSGWNAAAYLGGEIQRPSRNLPLALWVGTLLVTALYLLLNLVYISALSPDQMQGVLEVGDLAARALFGHEMGRWFSAGISLGLLSVVSAMIMAGPRVYYAMSRDCIFFPLFARVHSKRGTPAHAIGLQAAVAIIMIITAAYDQLLIYIGFTLSLFAMLTVAGLMVLRRRSPDASLRYKTWGYPATPLVFIIGNLWIVGLSIIKQPAPSLWGAATIAAGWGAYQYFNRRLKKGGRADAAPPPCVGGPDP